MDGRVHTVPQAEALGTGHALAQVSSEHRTPGPVVVLYGDTPLLRGSTLQSMLDAHLASGAAVTLLTAEMADPQGYGRLVRSPAGAGSWFWKSTGRTIFASRNTALEECCALSSLVRRR